MVNNETKTKGVGNKSVDNKYRKEDSFRLYNSYRRCGLLRPKGFTKPFRNELLTDSILFDTTKCVCARCIKITLSELMRDNF